MLLRKLHLQDPAQQSACNRSINSFLRFLEYCETALTASPRSGVSPLKYRPEYDLHRPFCSIETQPRRFSLTRTLTILPPRSLGSSQTSLGDHRHQGLEFWKPAQDVLALRCYVRFVVPSQQPPHQRLQSQHRPLQACVYNRFAYLAALPFRQQN